MRRLVLGYLVVMVLAAPARAGNPDEKSPLLAVSLSIGVTTAGALALIPDHDGLRFAGGMALFLGPSVGRWYAGEASVSGLGLRLLGTATMVAGLAIEVQRSCDDLAPCGGPDGGAIVLLGAGAALWVGSAILDTVQAHRAAHRWNATHAVTIAPTALRSGTSYGPGLAIGGEF